MSTSLETTRFRFDLQEYVLRNSRWGALAEIVTDNGPAFVQALDVLADRYNIQHIHISPYNSQANGVVEWRHLDVWEAIIKSTPGGSSAGIPPLTRSFGPSA